MLDLLTRLADSLAENAPLEAETEALLAEARRAIKEWRVIEVEGNIQRGGVVELNTTLAPVHLALETPAPDGPCTVTIIVRVAGER